MEEAADGFEPVLLLDLDANARQEVDERLLPVVMFASEPGGAVLDKELETNSEYWIELLFCRLFHSGNPRIDYPTGLSEV